MELFLATVVNLNKVRDCFKYFLKGKGLSMLKIWKANEDGRRMLTDGERFNGLCQVDRKPDCLIQSIGSELLLMLCCICNTLCMYYGFCESKYNKSCPCLTIWVLLDCID